MQRSTWGILAVALLGIGCAAGPEGTPGDGIPGAGGGVPGGNGSGGNGVGTGGSGAGTGGTVTGTGGSGEVACTPGIPATSQVPRLTNVQYNRTVRDLLGVETLTAANGVSPSTLLAPDQAGDMDRQTWTAYQNVAELIAAQVMADPALRQKFITCTPSLDCLTTTVQTFGRKAFRRKLDAEETTRFGQLITAALATDGTGITENGTPEEAAEVLLFGFLVSPSFIWRAEKTENADAQGNYVLSSYEVATRLGYMLTGSTPDADLNTAADNNALETPQQILEQAARLLGTAGAREMVAAFHQSYIGADLPSSRWQQAAGTGKDPSFTGFTKEIVPLFSEEEELLFDDVTFTQGGSFKDLLLTNVAFVTDQTAPFYGLSGTFGTTPTKTTLDESRPGFLTRLGFLANFADYSRSNPILRGAFIAKDVMGVDPGIPDPAAAMTALPEVTADLNTNRKRVEAMTAGGTCGFCHTPIVNPPGFAMESFNAVGAFQTTEASTGAAIDTAVDVTLDRALPPVRVASAKELMEQIAASPLAHRNYALKMVSFAYERSATGPDVCVAETLGNELQGGLSIKDALAKLAATESFRVRVVEEN